MTKTIFAFLVLFCNYYCYSQYKTHDSITTEFKIEKIRSIKDNYIIYASRNDTTYMIISQKVFRMDAEKIKEGSIYRLTIISYFQDIYPSIVNSLTVSPGCVVKRLNHTYQMYYSKDLTGLYLSPLTHLYYNINFIPSHYPYISGCFNVKKIVKKEGLYIIEAEKNSVIYWIASPVSPQTFDDNTNKFQNLKEGSLITLKLYSYFERENNFSRIIDGSVEVRPKKLIKPHPVTDQLYFTFDLIPKYAFFE